jgi:crotonyl-CoA carboxylase/reductase
MAVAQKKPPATPLKDLYEIREIPPLGHVPEKMYAWAIRKERHGPPETAMLLEVVPTWPIAEELQWHLGGTRPADLAA